TEIARLVCALASGKASSDIATAIAERRAKVEALTAAPEPTPLDRQSFLTGYAAFRVLLNQRHPVQVRQTLRKLGVDRIVVRRGQDGKSWNLEGGADVSSLPSRGAPPGHADSRPASALLAGHGTLVLRSGNPPPATPQSRPLEARGNRRETTTRCGRGTWRG